jgi:mono/diheme cytochrome c family protein
MLPATASVAALRVFAAVLALTLVSAGVALVAAAAVVPVQQPDAEVIEQGKMLYADQCASCHGMEGKGDGPAARFLAEEVPDLSTAEWKYAEDGSVAALAAVIKAGIDDSPMTPFEGTLSDEEINAVATYVVHVLRSKADTGG